MTTTEKYLEGVLIEFYWLALNDSHDMDTGKNDYSAQAKVARAEARKYAQRLAKHLAKKAKK